MIKYYLCGILMLQFFAFQAKNFEEIFLQANNDYLQGEFQQAFDGYNTIAHKGWATWYNMGACCYELDDYINGLINAEKAWHNGGSDNSELTALLVKLRQKLLVPENSENIGQSLLLLIKRGSLWFWQILFLCILLCVCVGYRKYNTCITVILCLLLLLSGICLFVAVYEKNKSYAIVLENKDLLIGKDDRFDAESTVSCGQKVYVTEHTDQWAKIIIDKKSGWIRSESLAFI